jgi:DNA-binding NarL/FixJ family response regulator/AraC-like DNA-binding protein
MPDIVIVDDEKIVRLGLKALLGECSPDAKVTGIFANGAEAAEFCAISPPCLLLTDIKMPVMDGLELIRFVHDRSPRTRIVVLTCHDDFMLVRSAFNLGADEYLLKDEVSLEELAAILSRLDPSRQDATTGSEGDKGTESHVFSISETDPDPEHADVHPRITHLLVECCGGATGNFVVALVDFKNAFGDDFKVIPWRPETAVLREFVKDAFAAVADSVAIGLSGDRAACLFRHEKTGLPEKRADVDTALRKLFSSFGVYLNRKPVVGLSNTFPATSLRAAFGSARSALSGAFFHAGPVVVHPTTKPSVPPALLSFELSAAVPLEAWSTRVRTWFNEVRKADSVSPEAVKAAVLLAVMNLDSRIADCCGRDGLAETGESFSVVEGLDDLSTLEDWLLNRLSRTSKAMASGRELQSLAWEVKRWIDCSYAEDITLEKAAAHFCVSTGRLCRVFHKEIGLSFIDCLNRVRVDKAKELLLTTSLSVKTLSFRVGYHNPNYFSRVFKRLEGMTISAFRNGC